MEDQEATPDQQGNMYDPDGFMYRMQTQKKPSFRSNSPDNKCSQVPSESGVKEEVVHSISLAGHPGCDKDHGPVSDGNDKDPGPFFSRQQGA